MDKENKITKFIKDCSSKKALLTGALTGLVLSSTSMVVFAAEAPSISSTITSSFNQVVSDTLSTISAIAPIGITIFAATFCWKYAKRFFTTVTK